MANKPVKLAIAGPSYTSESIIADCNRTVNWYPEIINDGISKPRIALYPTPGYSLYGTLTDNPVRGQLYQNSVHWAVGGAGVFNVASNGTPTALTGAVINDGLQVSMAASQTPQGLIISGGKGYSVIGSTVALITSAAFPANAIRCGYVDGYFIVAAADNRYYLSSLNDVTSWAAIDSDAIQFSANTLMSMLIDKREVILFGDRVSQAFYNSGRSTFPFESVPSGSMEFGTNAARSPVKIDNSYIWMHGDDCGDGTVVRADGYVPEHVSNKAVEYAINGYAVKSDAVAWALCIKGHNFYILTFPNANKTWAYDTETRMWFEWMYWNPTLARYEAHRGINHVMAFGNHIIGDRVNGKLYKLQLDLWTEDGLPSRRLRRAPHVSAGSRNVIHKHLWLGVEVGVGLAVSSGTSGYNPVMDMRFSDDGGKTYTSEESQSLGKAGEYSTLVEWKQLGSTNVSRVYEVSCYEPVPVRLMDAELDLEVV